VEGYLKAMKKVCVKYGVLFILDEVMCGMGRTGYTHAWQEENVVPDIQAVGKGLAGGYAPISAVLFGHDIVKAFQNGPGNGAFAHGHTFQNFPEACAAALAVQKIIEDDGLLANVREKGELLRWKLEEGLKGHRYVGDIRGKGLFLGVSVLNIAYTSYN
jgi:adenosylmethionine-8-amino-7-oxononanoate aminotransferase